MPVLNEIEIQREYWNREISAFDAIYTHDKGRLGNLLDSFFRKDMYLRYSETLAACEPLEGRRFLDVGCGTGVYALELARRGAQHVTGVDIAERMITVCRELAVDAGISNTTFVRGTIDDLPGDERWDVSFGIGLFDYIADALPTLRAMRRRSTAAVIASFPRILTWRAPVRKLRLSVRGCPVYFYSARSVRRLLAEAGLEPVELRRLGKLHFVIAKPNGDPALHHSTG